MKLVIDIPEEVYKKQLELYENPLCNEYIGNVCIHNAIVNGKPLPKGHGDLIDASKINFENADFDTYGDYCRAFDAIDQAEIIIPADKEEEA